MESWRAWVFVLQSDESVMGPECGKEMSVLWEKIYSTRKEVEKRKELALLVHWWYNFAVREKKGLVWNHFRVQEGQPTTGKAESWSSSITLNLCLGNSPGFSGPSHSGSLMLSF